MTPLSERPRLGRDAVVPLAGCIAFYGKQGADGWLPTWTRHEDMKAIDLLLISWQQQQVRECGGSPSQAAFRAHPDAGRRPLQDTSRSLTG